MFLYSYHQDGTESVTPKVYIKPDFLYDAAIIVTCHKKMVICKVDSSPAELVYNIFANQYMISVLRSPQIHNWNRNLLFRRQVKGTICRQCMYMCNTQRGKINDLKKKN